MDSLVSAEWLADHLGEPDLVVLDASWHMPASGRNARREYLERHIPGARFLDIDELSDGTHPAPHMLPPAAEFGRRMEELGVASDDRLVIYDNSPLHTAARGWFMLRHFGAQRIAILDGGFQKWLAKGLQTESGEPQMRPARFDPQEKCGDVVTKEQILSGIGDPLVDARSRARFEGVEAEPRAGVASGHIPGARNLPFSALYNEDGTFKTEEEIWRLLNGSGVDPSRPFVASCGSGVTANSLIFCAHLLGSEAKLYDGSWAEWGADPATPKATGPA